MKTLKSSITDLHKDMEGVKADVGKKVDSMKTDMNSKLDTILAKMNSLQRWLITHIRWYHINLDSQVDLDLNT